MTVMAEKAAADTAVRPFTIDVPEADLEDLRARVAATRWPDKETATRASRPPPGGARTASAVPGSS